MESNMLNKNINIIKGLIVPMPNCGTIIEIFFMDGIAEVNNG